MESPQASNLLKSIRESSVGGNAARHNAPMVERGDTSTRCPPTLIEDAIAMASAPPSRATSPGTVGRKAGSTTPDVLAYTDTKPVTKATTPVTDFGVENFASM